MKFIHNRLRSAANLGCILGLQTVASCMTGGKPEGAASAANLIEPDAGVIAAARWRQAPAGCEDLISSSDVHFGYAEGASGLGVVLSHGEILCVDSWAAIETELDHAKGDPSPDPMLPRPFDRPGL